MQLDNKQIQNILDRFNKQYLGEVICSDLTISTYHDESNEFTGTVLEDNRNLIHCTVAFNPTNNLWELEY